MSLLSKRKATVVGVSLAFVAWGAGAATPSPAGTQRTPEGTTAQGYANTDRSDRRDAMHDAAVHVNKSVGVIESMRADPKASQLLQEAKGVFIVPTYGRVALGVGGRGGAGVLLVRNGGAWSDPVFYNFGGVSAGVQAGIEGGSFVLVLNNDKAVKSFLQDNNWSLNAGAGLTIVDWSAKGQASTGKGDVTIWSNTKGLFGGATVSITDIQFDRSDTAAFYGRTVTAKDVVNGSVKSAQAQSLQEALGKA